MAHAEGHRNTRANWLRAAVLGANDGLISTSSLVVGVASAEAQQRAVFIAALAGMVAGALSMAAGEYVSVSSQSDIEKADVERERQEIAKAPEAEKAELARIYRARGLDGELAGRVAEQLMDGDALGAHVRDELGMHEVSRARPVQAGMASAAAFTLGALPPTLLAAFLPLRAITPVIVAGTLVLLVALGALAGRLGGASPLRGAARVTFWGAIAMGATFLVGRLFAVVT